MERGQLIETYRILQKCKLNGLKQNTKFALLHDMSILRPISLAWKDELEGAFLLSDGTTFNVLKQ